MSNIEKTNQFLSAYEMIQLDNFSDSQFDEVKLSAENVHWLASCESTSDYIKTKLADSLNEAIVCVSDVQTAGKGQHDKTWESPLGNLHFSIYLPINKHISQSKDMNMIDGRLSLETAIAMMGIPLLQTAKLNPAFKLGIKWPNDLCTIARSTQSPQGLKKFSGILIEPVSVKPKKKDDDSAEVTLYELPRICGVIIGIGMNANHTETTEINDQPIDNLQTMLNHTVSIPDLAAQACQACQKALDTFIYHSSSLPVRFFAYDLLYDKAIEVQQFNETNKGIATGIQSDGALTVMESLESTISVYDGSVRLAED